VLSHTDITYLVREFLEGGRGPLAPGRARATLLARGAMRRKKLGTSYRAG
jgi:hypothetical protein